MASTKLKERAAAIKKAEGSVFVFAATDRSVPKKSTVLTASYADHSCANCGTVVTASADTPNPFCVTCGSHHVKATSSATKANIPTTALASLRCGTCNTRNVTSKKILAAAQGKLHCVQCGNKVTAAETPVVPDLPKLDGGPISQKTLTVPDIDTFKIDTPVDEPLQPDLPVDKKPVTSGADEPPAPAELKIGTTQPTLYSPDISDSPGVPNDKDVTVSTVDDFEFDSEPTELLDDVETSAWAFDKNENAEDDMKTMNGETKADTEEFEEDFEEDDPDYFEESSQTAALIDNLDIDDTTASLAFVSVGNKLVAMKGSVAVASLNAKAAGDKSDLMHTDVMVAALTHDAKANGLRKSLTNAGFALIRIKAASNTLIDQKVNARVSEIAKVQDAKDKVLVESMALAAAGLARNHWKSVSNPLKAAVETEFARLGVTNPKMIASELFRIHGVEYAKSIVEMASKLQDKSVETRKELAEVLDMISDEPLDLELSVEGNSDEMPFNNYDSVEARLLTPATVMSNPRISTASLLTPRSSTTASTYDRAQAILQGNAPLTFSQ